MRKERNQKRILTALLAFLIIALFASASIYAQSNPNLYFNVPEGWTKSTVNGMTSYTSPDYSYTLIVQPFTPTASIDYTSRTALENFLKDSKWTSDNPSYTPVTVGNWNGYYTTAHTTLNGKDVTGYTYYIYDPNTPNTGYYYYMYSPTSSWKTSQSEMTNLLSTATYKNVDPSVQSSVQSSVYNDILFSLPEGWTSTTSNGITTYYSPDNSYTLVVSPYSYPSTLDYTSQAALDSYLKDYKWTADNAYNPYSLDNWRGYSTAAHSTIDGKDVNGYVYYGYDPNNPGKGYYYYMFTPSTNWSTGAAEMQKLLNSARYVPKNPNLEVK